MSVEFIVSLLVAIILGFKTEIWTGISYVFGRSRFHSLEARKQDIEHSLEQIRKYKTDNLRLLLVVISGGIEVFIDLSVAALVAYAWSQLTVAVNWFALGFFGDSIIFFGSIIVGVIVGYKLGSAIARFVSLKNLIDSVLDAKNQEAKLEEELTEVKARL